MIIQHKYLAGFLIISMIIGIYLNRSYAHFFSYINNHFQANPTSNSNYTIGNGPIIKYVALGDSLTAGTGAKNFIGSFPHQLAQKISANEKKVELLNLGQPGGKAKDAVDKQVKKAVDFKPNLITILIGTNDLHGRTDKKIFARELDKIIAELKTKTTARIIVANVPQLGAYPALLWPHNQYLDYQTRKFNTIIENIATANSVEFADLYSYSDGLNKTDRNFYSPDYFHPNENGYGAWAEYFYANYSK